MHAPITLSGKQYVLNKVYVLNKQVSKYMVIAFFSSKISIVSLALTGFRFVLPCVYFVHLVFLDHSMPDYILPTNPASLVLARPLRVKFKTKFHFTKS